MHRESVPPFGRVRRPGGPRSRLAAGLLAAFAAPAVADLRTLSPAPVAATESYAVHADADFGRVYALFDARRGAVVGLRHTREVPGIGSYVHRWLLGFEYRHADSLAPNLTFHPVSVGYAAGWNDDSRRLDGSLVFHRNLPGGRDGDAAALGAARAGAKAGYSLLRYGATLVQALPADWRLRFVAEGQHSTDALVPCEQFALGGHDSLRGFDERALAGDRGQRFTAELRTPDFGPRLRPRLSAQGLLFIDQGSVSRNPSAPGESASRMRAASIGFGLALSIAGSWQLHAEVARVRQSGTADAETLDQERGQVTVSWAH